MPSSIAIYGSWRSPISAELVAAGLVSLSSIQTDGDDVLWIEDRAAEEGRHAVVRHNQGRGSSDVIGPGVSARSFVQEYGGGAYLAAEGTVWFSDSVDGRLYEIRDTAGATPRPITPPGAWRYADLVLDRARRRLICIREDHTSEAITTHGEPVTTLVAVPLDGGIPRVLVGGNDFYSAPRVSPNGTHLAWLTWHHPNMPWDGTELWVGKLRSDGGIASAHRTAGGDAESIAQPSWSPEGVLHFVSDRSGWWNLERVTDLGPSGLREQIAPMKAELAVPDWRPGLSTYAFTGDGSIVAAARASGLDQLVRINAQTATVEVLETPFVEISFLRANGHRAVFVAGSPSGPQSIVALDLLTGARDLLRTAGDLSIAPPFLSVAEPVAFPTTGGRTAHGLYFAPSNPEFTGPVGTRPPLIVHAHGGPTHRASPALNLSTQFFTSRGLAYLDVDYGGSTGYGRAYREQLNGNWGIVDVDDCVAGARDMVARGLVDPDRLAISGPSAGGYTTLAAVAFRDAFQAGVSYFGLADLETFVRDTHKFESRYLERLVGPYPQRADVYRERSPVNFAHRIVCPVLILQGVDDRIVPLGQAEQMTAALRAAGLPYAYLVFEGEGHNFSKAGSIRKAIEAELSFYGQVFGFVPHGDVERVRVENLRSQG